jgi:ABC-type transport system substrate-binding protein
MSVRTFLFTTLIAAGVAATLSAQTPQQSPKPSPVPSPSAAPAASLTGPWTMTLDMQMGTATPALDLTQQGEKITGTYEGRYGKSQLTGTLKGRALEFSFTMNAEGTEVVMTFRGQVAGDFKSIKGDADLGGMGEASWSAVPRKK